MDTLRTSYVANTTKPGSEVSAEISAAFAASFMVFKSADSQYSNLLLRRASQVLEIVSFSSKISFEFIRSLVFFFFFSWSRSFNLQISITALIIQALEVGLPFLLRFQWLHGTDYKILGSLLGKSIQKLNLQVKNVIDFVFQDELIWAAAWLFKATNTQRYWKYVVDKAEIISDMF